MVSKGCEYVFLKNQIFHAKPVEALSWGAAASVGFAIYTIVGFEKWVRFGRIEHEPVNPRNLGQ